MNKEYKNTILWVGLLIAILFRLPGLNQSLWLDEAIQAHAVVTYDIPTLLKSYMPGDFNPPLSHIITWLLVRLLGESEIVLRLPSLVAGVLIVWLGYRFLKKTLPQTQTFLILSGTLLLATAPLLIYYSQEARAYELAAVLGTWSMVCFYETLFLKEDKKSEYWIVTIFMFLSHYLVWFLWPIQVVLALLAPGNIRRKIVLLIVPLLGILIVSPILITQLKEGTSAAQSLPVWRSLSSLSLKQLALIPIKTLIGRLPLTENFATGFLLGIPLFIWAVTVGNAVYKVLRNTKEKTVGTIVADKQVLPFVFQIFWLILPVFIGIIVALKVAVFTYFRFLFIVPAFYLLLVLSVQHLPKITQRAVILLFFTINIVTGGLYLLNNSYHREDWRSLAGYINSHPIADTVVMVGAVSRPFWYYDRDNHTIIDISEINRIKYEKSIWLITYGQPIFDPANSAEKTLTKNFGFKIIEEKNFRGDLTLKYLVNDEGLTAYSRR